MSNETNDNDDDDIHEFPTCWTVISEDGKEREVYSEFEPFKTINNDTTYLCDSGSHTKTLTHLLTNQLEDDQTIAGKAVDRMEIQLEILCRQSVESNNRCKIDINPNQIENYGNNSSHHWLGTAIQLILSKTKELTKPKKYNSHDVDDDDDGWNVPFEQIRMRPQEFQRIGSEGQIFYAKLNSNTPVAVKQVRDVALTKIRHLKELNHRNVLKFIGISETSKYYYIIMEWCPYGTLHEHIHSGRQLSPSISSNFIVQIANGMKYLHSKNIIHRDLKPSNILLTHNDILKISDFGTHKVFNDKTPITTTTCAGTYAYMAPEVIRDESYSFPIDIWSYGVVVWEMLIGEEPFRDLDSSAVIWAVGNDSFQLPIPSGLPEGVTKILAGCWTAHPDERFEFNQVLMILKGVAQEIGKIQKARWSAQQASWKKEVKLKLKKLMNHKNESSEEQFCRKDNQSIDKLFQEKREQKFRDRNRDIYLKLQECFLYNQRDREENQRNRQEIKRKEEDLAKREEKVRRREEEVKRREENLAKHEEKSLQKNIGY